MPAMEKHRYRPFVAGSTHWPSLPLAVIANLMAEGNERIFMAPSQMPLLEAIRPLEGRTADRRKIASSLATGIYHS